MWLDFQMGAMQKLIFNSRIVQGHWSFTGVAFTMATSNLSFMFYYFWDLCFVPYCSIFNNCSPTKNKLRFVSSDRNWFIPADHPPGTIYKQMALQTPFTKVYIYSTNSIPFCVDASDLIHLAQNRFLSIDSCSKWYRVEICMLSSSSCVTPGLMLLNLFWKIPGMIHGWFVFQLHFCWIGFSKEAVLSLNKISCTYLF